MVDVGCVADVLPFLAGGGRNEKYLCFCKTSDLITIG